MTRSFSSTGSGRTAGPYLTVSIPQIFRARLKAILSDRRFHRSGNIGAAAENLMSIFTVGHNRTGRSQFFKKHLRARTMHFLWSKEFWNPETCPSAHLRAHFQPRGSSWGLARGSARTRPESRAQRLYTSTGIHHTERGCTAGSRTASPVGTS